MKYIRNILIFVIAVVVLLIVALLTVPNEVKKVFAATPAGRLLPPLLPPLKVQREAHWLDQNWSNEDRFWFHHASQGTATFPIPYGWFVALEQPGLALSAGLIKDPDYLSRFGFIASPKTLDSDPAELSRYGFEHEIKTETTPVILVRTPAGNPDGLPVGFARTAGEKDKDGKPQPDQLGLTCAACHTGHIEFKGVSLRFDGGPAMIDLGKLTEAVGLSLFYTDRLPWRFNAFANRVLGEQAADPELRADLRTKLHILATGGFDQLKTTQSLARKQLAKRKDQTATEETEEGFGRLDALNRIGNQVFYIDQSHDGKTFAENWFPITAPVSFPPIWTVPWLSWAQYDASIGQPLVRNSGEALGVSAIINMTSEKNIFQSSVALNNLVVIEDLLKGPNPFDRKFSNTAPVFHGLHAPKWPSFLSGTFKEWAIDAAKVERGRVLYHQFCMECHLAPINDKAFATLYPNDNFWEAKAWRGDPSSERVLDVIQKPANVIGTDPEQSHVLQDRFVDVSPLLNLDPIKDLRDRWNCHDVQTAQSSHLPFSLALMIVVDRINDYWFEKHNTSPEDQKKIWGNRPNCPNRILGYKARPLDGVWATAPYLHNGSVPSLWWLLKPADERPKNFCVGGADFNPHIVGYDAPADGAKSCPDGETMFRTARSDGTVIIGNSTSGHSFEGSGPSEKAGVIGRSLNDDERFDLIEYLKTL